MGLQDRDCADGPELPALRSGGTFNSALPPKTFAGFVTATLALFLISFLSYRSLESRTDNANRMAQTLEVTQQVALLLSSLKDAETGERGFLLTGSDEFLEPYETAVRALPGELVAARRAVEGNPAQLQRLDSLEQLANEKMGEITHSIELKRSGRPGGGLDLRRAARGKQVMDQIRALAAEMSEVERKLLDSRTADWQQSVAFSTEVTWGGSAVLLLLVIAAAGYAIKPVKREDLVEALKRLEGKFTQKLRRVLVVEDDEVHRESTCRLLAGDDVQAVAVGTAAEALCTPASRATWHGCSELAARSR